MSWRQRIAEAALGWIERNAKASARGSDATSVSPPEVEKPGGGVLRRRALTDSEYRVLVLLWESGKLPEPPRVLWVPADPEPDLSLAWCPRCHTPVELLTVEEAERVREAGGAWPFGG